MTLSRVTNLNRTPIEDLYPTISDQGQELCQQWIEKYSAAKSVFYQVAELVKSEVDQWKATTGEKPTYGKIRRYLFANDLVKKLRKMRSGSVSFAFNAARTDISADLNYQQRIKDWEKTATERLHLNPKIEIPFYVSHSNFHWCPYIATNSWEEQFLGCVWDIGTSIMDQSSSTVRSYSLGSGRLSRMVEYLSEHFPNFKPQRILDIGCSAGSSTIAIAMEFPEAEIHSIDVSSSMLRCGHALSVALDLPIHYHQMDASKTTFPDGSFDLIVSNIVFHELPNGIRRRVILECSRLLSSGGIMAHMEGGTYMAPTNIFQKLWRELDIHGNNEWYIGNASMEKLAVYIEKAGLNTQGSLLQKITPSSEFFEGALLIGGQKI